MTNISGTFTGSLMWSDGQSLFSNHGSFSIRRWIVIERRQVVSFKGRGQVFRLIFLRNCHKNIATLIRLLYYCK